MASLVGIHCCCIGRHSDYRCALSIFRVLWLRTSLQDIRASTNARCASWARACLSDFHNLWACARPCPFLASLAIPIIEGIYAKMENIMNWEYKTIYYESKNNKWVWEDTSTSESLTTRLNSMGKNGWELCAANPWVGGGGMYGTSTYGVTYIFKRPAA